MLLGGYHASATVMKASAMGGRSKHSNEAQREDAGRVPHKHSRTCSPRKVTKPISACLQPARDGGQALHHRCKSPAAPPARQVFICLLEQSMTDERTIVAVHQHAPPARQVPQHECQRGRQACAQRRAVALWPRDRQPQVARRLFLASSAAWPVPQALHVLEWKQPICGSRW